MIPSRPGACKRPRDSGASRGLPSAIGSAAAARRSGLGFPDGQPYRMPSTDLFAIESPRLGLKDRHMDYLSRARRVVEIELAEVRSVAGRLDSSLERAVHLIKSAV